MDDFIERIVKLDESTSSLDQEYKVKEADLQKLYKKKKADFELELENRLKSQIDDFESQANLEYKSKKKEIKDVLNKKLNLIMDRYRLEKPGIIYYITKSVLERDNKDGRS